MSGRAVIAAGADSLVRRSVCEEAVEWVRTGL